MGEFWAPGAEIWLFKKKNMDRSIDLAVQHNFISSWATSKAGLLIWGPPFLFKLSFLTYIQVISCSMWGRVEHQHQISTPNIFRWLELLIASVLAVDVGPMRVSLSKEEPDEKNWRNIGLQFSDQSFVSKISNHQIQFYIDQEAKFSFHISRTRMRYINLKVRYHNNIVDK